MHRLVLLLATILWSAAFAIPVPSELGSSVLECTREFSYQDYEASDVLPALVVSNADGDYSNNQGCLVQFRTKDFPLVFQLTFGRFELENSWECQWDSLCVDSQKYCGDILNNETLQIRVPANNSISLWFRTDGSVTKPGFEVLVEAVVDSDSLVEDYEDRCKSDVEYVSDYVGSEGEEENYETQYLEEVYSYPNGIYYEYDDTTEDGYYYSDNSSDYYSSEYQEYSDYDYNSESNQYEDYYNSNPNYYQYAEYQDSDSNYYNYDSDYNTYSDSNSSYEYYENGNAEDREEGSRRKREVKSDDNNYIYDNQEGVEFDYYAYYYNYNSDRNSDSNHVDYQEYSAYDYDPNNTETDYNYDEDSYYYDSNYDYNTEYNYYSEYVYGDEDSYYYDSNNNDYNTEYNYYSEYVDGDVTNA